MNRNTRVIFTADDFGLTAGVTAAIVEAMHDGVVTSTSVLVCRDNHELITRWAGQVQGSAGLHLQLTDGVPCSPSEKVPTLVDDAGRFPGHLRSGCVLNDDEIFSEWTAQLHRLHDCGISPTHVDTHHHIHTFPNVLPIYARFAHHTGLPARSGVTAVTAYLRKCAVRCADTCDTFWFRPEVTKARLLSFVRKNLHMFANGVIEFMCHPGYVDDDLRKTSRYVEERYQELLLLRSVELRVTLESLGIKLISMGEIEPCKEQFCNSTGHSVKG